MRYALSSPDNAEFLVFVDKLRLSNLAISDPVFEYASTLMYSQLTAFVQVQTRVEEIERPKVVLASMQAAINAPRISASQLTAALHGSHTCTDPNVTAASSDIARLQAALKALDNV
jgi:hypothetical protein